MLLKGKRIGFGLIGFYCMYDVVMLEIEKFVNLGVEVLLVVFYMV